MSPPTLASYAWEGRKDLGQFKCLPLATFHRSKIPSIVFFVLKLGLRADLSAYGMYHKPAGCFSRRQANGQPLFCKQCEMADRNKPRVKINDGLRKPKS